MRLLFSLNVALNGTAQKICLRERNGILKQTHALYNAVMFKRRTPRTMLQKIRQFFWPSMGIARFLALTKHRILRLKDTPHNIAIGLAAGAAVSFSPLMGTHIIQAMLITFILRGNIIASVIGTLVGNPWTFPFIWAASLKLGAFICAIFGLNVQGALPDDLSFAIVWRIFKQEPLRLFLPWLMGGYILAITTFGLYYGAAIYVLKNKKDPSS